MQAQTELYELRDGADVAKVKPCRICGGRPTFYCFETTEMENGYHLGCNRCDIANIQLWGYEELVETWNNWAVDIDCWKENVDYPE